MAERHRCHVSFSSQMVSKGALNGMDLTCKLLVRDIASRVRENIPKGV